MFSRLIRVFADILVQEKDENMTMRTMLYNMLMESRSKICFHRMWIEYELIIDWMGSLMQFDDFMSVGCTRKGAFFSIEISNTDSGNQHVLLFLGRLEGLPPQESETYAFTRAIKSIRVT